MVRMINVLMLGFYLSFTACAQINVENSSGKRMIKFDEIERIEMKPNSQLRTNKETELKVLTNEQTEYFIDKWNNKISGEPCKFSLKYWVFVILKDGEVRTFRVNGSSVKEDNDWCYDMSEDQFFYDLYINANPTLGEKEKTFDLIQGIWHHTLDDLALIAINNYYWRFKYEGEEGIMDDHYSITIKDKLPKFVDETLDAEFLILTNQRDTIEYEVLGITDSIFSLRHFPTGKIHTYSK